MRVIAADSGAAILNPRFEPLQIVAAATVLVEPPYRRASEFLVEPIFAPIETGHALIIHELELCQKLLKDVRAQVVHLDMSMGGLLVEEISPVQLRGKARSSILRILPKLRKLSTDIKRIYGVDVLAIGKESIPVRIAELTTGAHAVLYVCEKMVKEGKEQLLGLPSKCYARIVQNRVTLHSLIPAEHDVVGYAEDKEKVLNRIQLMEMANPCARGFRILKISPKKQH
ncbi:MAG: DUF4152 family protein [Candidatus Bathyarchaeota archaeon]|nr:MAG: DUF4152 family protein [Candidatus Bathyarchaeota archaeon]